MIARSPEVPLPAPSGGAGRGFSLIEVVIAVAIVGATLAALAALISVVPLTRDTHHADLALTIAEDEIGALRAAGYAALPASGSFSHPLLAELPAGTTTLAVVDYNDGTKQVDVTVSWQDPGQETRAVSLTTLVTETGGLP
jgi:prepilin-type N-terminal cleavage/methylation domain-containing protein